jgi:16S rRNA (cytidine1402-2'-O)-methyltransferase
LSLKLIATPIGNPGDITLRAIETLKAAEVVIGEERKEVSKLLRALDIQGKNLELLNEHSTDADVAELLILCREKEVALVSDCGTPGFCDPGARLVAACRAEGLISLPVPGASSLMCLLAITGQAMREFVFRGFLPAEREARNKALRELEREVRPVILMDTPYRLTKLMQELAEKFPTREIVLGCDFTQPSEVIFSGTTSSVAKQVGERKAEFILALFAKPQAQKVAANLTPLKPKTTSNQKARPATLPKRR